MSNHGIDDLVVRQFAAARAFFELPVERKMEIMVDKYHRCGIRVMIIGSRTWARRARSAVRPVYVTIYRQEIKSGVGGAVSPMKPAPVLTPAPGCQPLHARYVNRDIHRGNEWVRYSISVVFEGQNLGLLPLCRGYTPMSYQTLDPKTQKAPDNKEGLNIGLEVPADSVLAAKPLHGPNNWPDPVCTSCSHFSLGVWQAQRWAGAVGSRNATCSHAVQANPVPQS